MLLCQPYLLNYDLRSNKTYIRTDTRYVGFHALYDFERERVREEGEGVREEGVGSIPEKGPEIPKEIL